MTPQHQQVLSLISEGKVTQQQIADKVFVGWHEKYEQPQRESTLRKVRQIIRDLRIQHGEKIVSDVRGYWIPKDETEINEYLERLEKVARAQAKSHMVTYHAMKENFNVKSDYFEQLNLFQ